MHSLFSCFKHKIASIFGVLGGKIGVFHGDPLFFKPLRHLLPVARPDTPQLLFGLHGAKNGNIVDMGKIAVHGVAPLHHEKFPVGDGNFLAQCAAAAVKRTVGKALCPLAQGFQHFFKQPLPIQIATRLGKARFGALVHLQK